VYPRRVAPQSLFRRAVAPRWLALILSGSLLFVGAGLLAGSLHRPAPAVLRLTVDSPSSAGT
jgi:hypothetical protein